MRRRLVGLVVVMAISAAALIVCRGGLDPSPVAPEQPASRSPRAGGEPAPLAEPQPTEPVRDLAAVPTAPAPAWRVHGIVRSETARIRDALVEVVLRAGDDVPRLRFTTQSDVNGRFDCRLDGLDRELPWLGRATTLEVRATAARHIPGPWTVVPKLWSARPAAEVELVLRPGASLRGRVLDEESRPVVGARVSLYEEGSWRYVASDTTDGSGEFVLGARRAGHHRAGAGHASVGVAVGEPRWLDPSRDQRCPDLVLRPSASIAGRVRTGKGVPLGGIRLDARLLDEARSSRPDPAAFPVRRLSHDAAVTRTAADGRFRFPALLPGRYRVRILHLNPGDAPSPLELETGTHAADLVADLAFIDVRVVDGGRPPSVNEIIFFSWHEPAAARQAQDTFRQRGFVALADLRRDRSRWSVERGQHAIRPGFFAARLEDGAAVAERAVLVLEPGSSYTIDLAPRR